MFHHSDHMCYLQSNGLTADIDSRMLEEPVVTNLSEHAIAFQTWQSL